MIDIMRTVHGAYAPVTEPFGTRLETFFIGLCVALGDIDGKAFSVAKVAAYMRVPRTTVIRRLDQLQSWGLIDRRGRHYYLHGTTLNSANGMRTYQQAQLVVPTVRRGAPGVTFFSSRQRSAARLSWVIAREIKRPVRNDRQRTA